MHCSKALKDVLVCGPSGFASQWSMLINDFANRARQPPALALCARFSRGPQRRRPGRLRACLQFHGPCRGRRAPSAAAGAAARHARAGAPRAAWRGVRRAARAAAGCAQPRLQALPRHSRVAQRQVLWNEHVYGNCANRIAKVVFRWLTTSAWAAGPPPGVTAAAGAKKAPVISGATTVVKMPRAQVGSAT